MARDRDVIAIGLGAMEPRFMRMGVRPSSSIMILPVVLATDVISSSTIDYHPSRRADELTRHDAPIGIWSEIPLGQISSCMSGHHRPGVLLEAMPHCGL